MNCKECSLKDLPERVQSFIATTSEFAWEIDPSQNQNELFSRFMLSSFCCEDFVMLFLNKISPILLNGILQQNKKVENFLLAEGKEEGKFLVEILAKNVLEKNLIVSATCFWIFRALFLVEPNRVLFGDSVCKFILQTASDSSSDPLVLRTAFSCLANIFATSSFRKTYQQSFLPVFCRILREQTKDAFLMREVCASLCNLLYEASTDVQLVNEQILPHLLEIIKLHNKVERTTFETCCCLSNVCGIYPEIAKTKFSIIIPSLLSALTNFGESVAIVSECCGCLSNIFAINDTAIAISFKKEILPVLVALVSQHQQDKDLVTTINNVLKIFHNGNKSLQD